MSTNGIGKKLFLCFATAALAVGSAATYNFTLFSPVVLAGKELKPGDYKLELKDHSAVIRQGKGALETEVKTETADANFRSTTVKYSVSEGKNVVQEIQLRGTKTRLVFEPGHIASGGL